MKEYLFGGPYDKEYNIWESRYIRPPVYGNYHISPYKCKARITWSSQPASRVLRCGALGHKLEAKTIAHIAMQGLLEQG